MLEFVWKLTKRERILPLILIGMIAGNFTYYVPYCLFLTKKRAENIAFELDCRWTHLNVSC